MWGKALIFVVGATVGWIIGARSGRPAYERVADEASKVWRSPQLRRVTGQVQRTVREKVPGVGDAAGDAMEMAAERADEFADRHRDDA